MKILNIANVYQMNPSLYIFKAHENIFSQVLDIVILVIDWDFKDSFLKNYKKLKKYNRAQFFNHLIWWIFPIIFVYIMLE